MSNVKAFICDHGNHLCKEDDTVAINPVEDMFDKQSSFPTIFKHQERYNIHYCTECYRDNVLHPASLQVDRSKDERGYELKVKELSYNFRNTIVSKWLKKHRPKSEDKGRKKHAK